MPPRPRNNREMLRRIKLASGCIDCGYKAHHAALEFDHRPGEVKVDAVAAMTTCSRKKLLAEIAKCDVVCANCHRIRTFTREQDGNQEAKWTGVKHVGPFSRLKLVTHLR